MSDKQWVIITGALGGVGKDICQHFYKTYNLVLIDYKRDETFLEELHNVSENCIEYYSVDLSNENEVLSFCSEMKNKDIKLKALVLNAGVMEVATSSNTSIEMWNRTFNVNVTSNFIISKELAPLLAKQGVGHIVAIGSVLGEVAGYDLLAYSTSKAALSHLCKNLALEMMDHNIYVNCIAPGFIKTDLYNKAMSTPGKSKNWLHVLGGLPNKLVLKKDIVLLIEYLINQQSVNGQTIVIDNGYSIR